MAVWQFTFHSFSKACITPSPTLAKQYKHPNAIGILNGCNTSEFTTEGKLHKDIETIESYGEKVGQYNVQNKIRILINILAADRYQFDREHHILVCISGFLKIKIKV